MSQPKPEDQGTARGSHEDDDTDVVAIAVPPPAPPEDIPPASDEPAPGALVPVEPPAAVTVGEPLPGNAALPPSPPPPAPPAVVAPASVPPAPVEVKEGPGLLVRALWFLFVGWWLSAVVSVVAWVALVTIVGIPLGIWLINRLPTVVTLRPRTRELQAVMDASGVTRLVAVSIPQQPWWLRGIWFLVIGWWASAIVMILGWALIVLILTLPIGLWMFNRVPFVASLYRY